MYIFTHTHTTGYAGADQSGGRRAAAHDSIPHRYLQCVAICRSMLKCVAVCCTRHDARVLQCVAVCFSVLQCVAYAIIVYNVIM